MIKISKQDAAKIRAKFKKLHFTINTTPSYAYIPESVDFKVFAERRFQDVEKALNEFKETNKNFYDIEKFKFQMEAQFREVEKQRKITALRQLIWALENTHPYDAPRIPAILKNLRYTLNCTERTN